MKIGIISDDLTGGGDVGVQFADMGYKVVLSIDSQQIKNISGIFDVWIINTQSRHISPEKAKLKVQKALSALNKWGADYFYKKIDSTLRGNIGAELEVLTENKQNVPLCAAYPEMGRTTKNSIHYVWGEPVSESVYGRDVNCPVRESNIKKLLKSQMREPEYIKVLDAITDEDLERLANRVKGNVFAGSSVWAGKLAAIWMKNKIFSKI